MDPPGYLVDSLVRHHFSRMTCGVPQRTPSEASTNLPIEHRVRCGNCHPQFSLKEGILLASSLQSKAAKLDYTPNANTSPMIASRKVGALAMWRPAERVKMEQASACRNLSTRPPKR